MNAKNGMFFWKERMPNPDFRVEQFAIYIFAIFEIGHIAVGHIFVKV